MSKNVKTKPKKKHGIFKTFALAIASILMVGAIIFFGLEISKEVKTTFTLLTDINNAKKELAELKEEEQYLTKQKEQLSDENYVKAYARGEFLITQQGEEVYRLPALSE